MAGYFSGYRRVILSLVLLLPILAMLTLATPVLAAPVIVISPISGAIGTNITVNGNNFDSYIGDYVTITFGASEVSGSPLLIPDSGDFSLEFTVPETAASGQQWISIYSTAQPVHLLAQHSFVIEKPLAVIDVSQGPVGTEVNFTGQGFYSNRIIDFYYYNVSAEKLGDTIASATGLFNFNFTVPHSISGSHRVVAHNDRGNEIETAFTVIPEIVMNTTVAGPGNLVTLAGTGFGYRTDVNIILGVRPITTVRTSDKGDFEVVFNIPDVLPKTYDMKAEDVYKNQAKIRFTVAATIGLSPTSGAIGSEVTITGDGFTPGKGITTTFDGTVVLSAVADIFGEFTATFDVPPSISGTHQITVTDGTYTEDFIFFVEAESPLPPILLLPSNQTDTRSRTYFDWQDVTDPSGPVVYRLQIADDQNFSSIILNITEIPDSEYTLTEAQALPAVPPDLPYYWRVRAKDSAGNQSEWSSPWSFILNTPMMPGLLLPDTDTKVEAPAYFDWQDVSSLNPPVTYNLQIGTDLGFSSAVLERIGLTVSEYILTKDDKLPKTQPDTPYYWRIKAIDNAQNEGEWSTPGLFYYQSGFTFPSWAIYTLIGIAAILVGYLAYWLGRRVASKPPDQK